MRLVGHALRWRKHETVWWEEVDVPVYRVKAPSRRAYRDEEHAERVAKAAAWRRVDSAIECRVARRKLLADMAHRDALEGEI